MIETDCNSIENEKSNFINLKLLLIVIAYTRRIY